MSFLRHERSTSGGITSVRNRWSSAQTSPSRGAGYSLASCSPAELASASPADVIFTLSAGTVNCIPNEMLEPPTMAQQVRTASSEPDGVRAIPGR